MTVLCKSLLSLSLLALVGCSDKPHEYGRGHPDVDSLDPRDRGLQSKDVIAASDQMAMDLLQCPELANSQSRWTIVATGMENQTLRRRCNYDVFMERLKANLADQAQGRIQLIQNRDTYRNLQNRELEGAERNPGPAGTQPQLALKGTVMDLPNRGTDYFLFTFELDDLNSREVVWGPRKYEVKVAR